NQRVKRPARAGERAGGGEGIREGLGRQLLGVVSRLGGGSDEAAHFAGLSAGVRRVAIAEVLPHLARRRRGGAIIVTFPTRIAIEALRTFLGHAQSHASSKE